MLCDVYDLQDSFMKFEIGKGEFKRLIKGIFDLISIK